MRGVRRRLRLLLFAAVLVAGVGSSHAQEPDPADSAVWKRVRASLFDNAPIDPADAVLTLDAPRRAEDAAIVPVAIRSSFPQSRARFIRTVWLVVDNNPSPIAAVFHFTPESGRADMETRIRVEQYTHVRAIAQTSDGRLYMASRYVKASGGCSAPAGKDAVAANASIGRIRMRTGDLPGRGQPAPVQLMISHPNDSGLAMDQVTRTYAVPHFVQTVDVRFDGKPVMSAEVDFSISENPNFRFYYTPGDGGMLEARVVDNQGFEFAATAVAGPANGPPASTRP